MIERGAAASQPTIETRRLVLRPFTADDAPEVRRLAGAREVAATTILIPHPYPEGLAESWIATHASQFRERTAAHFAIVREETDDLVGAISLSLTMAHEHAELGYWVGVPYWGRGFASEAAAALLVFGFRELGLHRIHAHHMTRNAASGHVLEKIGMRREGELREHIAKWGRFEDVVVYGILREEWGAAGE